MTDSKVVHPLPAHSPQVPWRQRLVAAYYGTPPHPAKLRLLTWLRALLNVDVIRKTVSPGLVMELDDGDYLQREVLLHGAYEPRSLALLPRLLEGAQVFVDVGAHVGLYTTRAAHLLRGRGRVLAFEPTPVNAARLRRNLALNQLDNVTLFACAVSDSTMLVPMSAPPQGNPGGVALAANHAQADFFAVAIELGNAFRCAGVTTVDVVKIDVEGHEVQVLRSLFAAVEPLPRHLIVEYQPGNFAYAGGPRAVPDLLVAHGYRLRTVTGEPCLPGHPVPEDNLWASLSD